MTKPIRTKRVTVKGWAVISEENALTYFYKHYCQSVMVGQINGREPIQATLTYSLPNKSKK